MSVYRQTADGRWLPAEPLPEPFGVLWERLWHERRRRGGRKWPALVASFHDARAISKLAGRTEIPT